MVKLNKLMKKTFLDLEGKDCYNKKLRNRENLSFGNSLPSAIT